jgi:hypothetical protein
MNPQTFITDIPYDLANRAHAGTSHAPEQRAQSEQTEYASTLAGDFEALSAHASTDEKRALLETEFARYRAGYRERVLDYLRSRSRCLSPMITGPSNFPLRRNQKRNAVADRRLSDLLGYRESALEAIRRKLHPEWRPIMAGDADALPRLETKLAKLEKAQADMRAVNAAMRRHAKAGPMAQARAMIEACPDLGEARAHTMLLPDCLGRTGFANYELTNNNANIRRIRTRIEELKRDKVAPEVTQEGHNGIRLEDHPAENRVRLFFPGKPDAGVRTRLKSNAFRWTPSLGCWQAYRNPRSMELARQFVTAEMPAT